MSSIHRTIQKNSRLYLTDEARAPLIKIVGSASSAEHERNSTISFGQHTPSIKRCWGYFAGALVSHLAVKIRHVGSQAPANRSDIR